MKCPVCEKDMQFIAYDTYLCKKHECYSVRYCDGFWDGYKKGKDERKDKCNSEEAYGCEEFLDTAVTLDEYRTAHCGCCAFIEPPIGQLPLPFKF